MTEPIAWMSGQIQPFSQTAVPVWDLGVVAGASVTEMARTYRHQPFRIERHVQRIMKSLSELGFPIPWSADKLMDAVQTVVAANGKLIPPARDLGIVLFSTAGSNSTYLGGVSHQTTTVVHTFELPFHLWKPALMNGVHLRIPEVRQVPDDCFPVVHKVRNRLHWWLADQQAAKLEPGSRALLLDHEDFVTETSTSCFYLVREGRIATSNRGVLNSLSSQIVEELASSLQIPFERRAIAKSELDSADEAFLSSTPVGLLPVSLIDGRSVPWLSADSICRRLVEAWNRITGVNMFRQIEQS